MPKKEKRQKRRDWFLNLKDTSEINVPKKIADQVIGQDDAVKVIKKAANQRRHVLLIGEPGTGKSMLGLALAELLPKEKLVDIVAFPNPNDENQPIIKTMPAGQGREIVEKSRIESMSSFKSQNAILFALAIVAMIAPWWARNYYKSDIMFVAFFLGGILFLVGAILFANFGIRFKERAKNAVLIVDNYRKDTAPFLDATGAHAGALLGDVLHDPFQCIPMDERVNLANGKQVPVAHLVDPLIEKDGERELRRDEQFDVLGTINDKFGYKPARVTKIFRRQFEGDLISIETRRGYRIRVTPNHPIAIYGGYGKIKFVSAASVTKGMLSIVPDRLPINSEGRLPLSFLHFIAEVLADGNIRDRSVAFKVRTGWKAKQYQ